MGLKKFRLELDEKGKEKFKEACYPCTKHNDCTRSFNNKPTTVEECNTGYTVFKIDPPPADFPAPSPKSGKRVGKDVSSTSGGGGPALMFALLPLFSYCSSCCLFFCCIFFVVKMAMKQPPSK